MANISDAQGTVTFIAEDIATIKALYSAVFEATKDWEYGCKDPSPKSEKTVEPIDAADCALLLQEAEGDVLERGNDVECSFRFYGNGRWSLENTLKTYMMDIAENVTNPLLIKKLRNSTFDIIWDYEDIEEGVGLNVQQTLFMHHDENTPIGMTRTTDISEIPFPLNHVPEAMEITAQNPHEPEKTCLLHNDCIKDLTVKVAKATSRSANIRLSGVYKERIKPEEDVCINGDSI